MSTPKREPLRFGLVGGSNSVMRPGYVTAMLDALGDRHGVEFAEVVDLAVGATTSFNGLMEMIDSDVHRRVDVLLFEYALNDVLALKAKPEMLELWGRCFEGIVRRARADNPDLLMVNLILGSRRARWRTSLEPISAHMHYICRRYGVPVIDINEWLTLEHADLLADDDFYGDNQHYARPSSTDLIGNHVADRLADLIRGRTPQTLPPPVFQDHLADVTYTAELSRFSANGPLPAKRFHNSRYDYRALVLEEGNELRLRLSGVIYGLRFISEPFSGLLEVDDGTSVSYLPTMRKTMLTGNFKWLLGNIVPELNFGVRISSAGQTPLRIRMAPADDRVYDDETGLVGKSRFAAPMDTSQGLSLSLLGILYKGHVSAAT